MWWVPVAAAVPDVDAPLRTGASAPADAAVVLGIEDYAFLADVPSASRDARALYHFFVYTRGIPAEHVSLVSGGNREQILAAVQRAQSQVGPGGTLWVHFAGHGATDPDTGAPLLVGDDAKSDPTVFVGRSVKVSELPQKAVLLLDTCWAGKGRDGVELVPGARFAVPTSALAAKGGAMVTAAQPSQLSEPYAAADHGLFSYFFAGAVRGWADGELDGAPDGTVTLREAHAFVSRAIATVHPSGQQPTFTGDDRPLVVAPGRLESAPDLAALPKVGRGPSPVSPAPLGTPVLGSSPQPPATWTPQWTGTPMLPVGKTWSGGLELVDGRTVKDAEGARSSLQDAARVTSTEPAVARAWVRTEQDRRFRSVGLTVMGTGIGLGALYTALAGGSFESTGAIVLPLTAGGAALLGGGVMFGAGQIGARHRRELLVDAINAAP